jgi:hypothetical protein
MTSDLTTTNVFLGIMAVASVLQVLVPLAIAAAAFAAYRRVLRVVDSLEERQVAPAVARVNAILDDVKGVTATVKRETGQIERLVEWMIEGIARRRRGPSEHPPTRVM